MSKPRLITFLVLAAICAVAIPLFAFAKEGDEQTSLVEVKEEDKGAQELFNVSCGTCHTLAAGGTDGVVGPDLDDLLVPTGVNDTGQFEGQYLRVLGAVQCGLQGRMPKGILIGEEAKQVAGFVAAYAGRIGQGPTVDLQTVELPDTDCPEPQSEDSAQ